MTRKKILGYSILILFGVLLGIVTMLFQINKSPTMSIYAKLSIASDAFFFPGVFLLCVWLTAFFKRGGFYDFLVLSVFAIIKLVKKDFVPVSCRKAYRKFKNVTKEETRCLLAVLIIALVFLVLAATFMILAKYIL